MLFVLGADEISKTTVEMDSSTDGFQCSVADRSGSWVDKYTLFEKFSYSGLRHLGIEPPQDMDLDGLWRECQPSVVCLFASYICSFPSLPSLPFPSLPGFFTGQIVPLFDVIHANLLIP